MLYPASIQLTYECSRCTRNPNFDSKLVTKLLQFWYFLAPVYTHIGVNNIDKPHNQRDKFIFCILKNIESFQRYILQIYLRNTTTVGCLFRVSSNMFRNQTQQNHIDVACFSFTTCPKIIITQTTMKKLREEPESWYVIDTLDSEQEIQDQQGFLFLAAVAIFQIWNPIETQSQCNHQNGSINHDLTGIIMHVTKIIHESRFHSDYCMSFQAFNHPPATGTTLTFHHS